MTPLARALTDIFIAFVLPSGAIVGGYALRRKNAGEDGSRNRYWAGNLLMAGGALMLSAIGALILIMKYW